MGDSNQNEQQKPLEEGPKVLEAKFIQKGKLDTNIESEIKLTLAVFTDASPPTKICEALKAMLDSKFGKGWCVFAGAHLAGSAIFEEGFFAQIVFGNYLIIAFRTFIPPN